MTTGPEIPTAHDLGLNELLASARNLTTVETYKERHAITPTEWANLHKALGVLVPLMQGCIHLDAQKIPNVFTLDTVADNGMFFAIKNTKDPLQTTTIYKSSHGINISDWGPGLSIPKDRVQCHQLSIVSRRKLSPHLYAASTIVLRTSPDFRLIEGDPSQKTELEAAGLYSDDKTFLFDSITRTHMLTLEAYDPETDEKVLAPQISDPQDILRLTHDSNQGRLFWNFLNGTLSETEVHKLAEAVLRGTTRTDNPIEGIIAMYKVFLEDISAHEVATIKIAPTSPLYTEDLYYNLTHSVPTPLVSEVLYAKDFDHIRVIKKAYTEKLAQKQLNSR